MDADFLSSDDKGYPLNGTDQHVTPCNDDSFCCGVANTACCDQGRGVWIVNGTTTRVNPNATAADPTSDTTSNSTSNTTVPGTASNSTNPAPESSAISGGAIAGIVIGVLAGVLAIALVIWLLARRRYRRQLNSPHETEPQPQASPLPEKSYRQQEKDSITPTAEMPGSEQRQELPGSGGFRELS